MSRAIGKQSKSKAIYSFVWQRARETGEDRECWITPGQTRAVFRVKGGEMRVCVWNKGRPMRTTDLLIFKEQAKIPDDRNVHQRDVQRDEWHGVDFRWVPHTGGG